MKLTAEQLKTFDEQGYLFFPDCFSEEEVVVLRSEAESITTTWSASVAGGSHRSRTGAWSARSGECPTAPASMSRSTR